MTDSHDLRGARSDKARASLTLFVNAYGDLMMPEELDAVDRVLETLEDVTDR